MNVGGASGPAEDQKENAGYVELGINDLQTIISNLNDQNTVMMSVRALKRIVSSGNDSTIRMILETYGGTLGKVLPALLLFEGNFLSNMTF